MKPLGSTSIVPHGARGLDVGADALVNARVGAPKQASSNSVVGSLCLGPLALIVLMGAFAVSALLAHVVGASLPQATCRRRALGGLADSPPELPRQGGVVRVRPRRWSSDFVRLVLGLLVPRRRRR